MRSNIKDLKCQLTRIEDGHETVLKRVKQLELNIDHSNSGGCYTDIIDTPDYSDQFQYSQSPEQYNQYSNQNSENYDQPYDYYNRPSDYYNQPSDHLSPSTNLSASSSSSCSSLFNAAGQQDRYKKPPSYSAAHQPSPLPKKIVSKNSLSSAEIKKNKLIPVEKVLALYPKMKNESKVGTLSVKLARQAFFGDHVMKQCTVQGVRDFPGLPSSELGELKQTIFQLFPHYWSNPSEFESVWSTCIESIGQACKRLRSKVI